MTTPVRPQSRLACRLRDHDTHREALVDYATPPWDALLEWLRFHDIDPDHVMGSGSVITVDRGARQIRYTAIVLDEQGHKVIDPARESVVTRPALQQGEALAPLPTILEELFA